MHPRAHSRRVLLLVGSRQTTVNSASVSSRVSKLTVSPQPSRSFERPIKIIVEVSSSQPVFLRGSHYQSSIFEFEYPGVEHFFQNGRNRQPIVAVLFPRSVQQS